MLEPRHVLVAVTASILVGAVIVWTLTTAWSIVVTVGIVGCFLCADPRGDDGREDGDW